MNVGVTSSSLDAWSKWFISGNVYSGLLFLNLFMCRQTKETCPYLHWYNITWFDINSVVPAVWFVSHIGTQDVETECGKKDAWNKRITQKWLEQQTHPSASLQMSRGKNIVPFPAEMFAWSGFQRREKQECFSLCALCLQFLDMFSCYNTSNCTLCLRDYYLHIEQHNAHIWSNIESNVSVIFSTPFLSQTNTDYRHLIANVPPRSVSDECYALARRRVVPCSLPSWGFPVVFGSS